MISVFPAQRGGLILPLSFPQALSTEFRVHWRDGHAPSAQTGLRWSPGPMNSFFNLCIYNHDQVNSLITMRYYSGKSNLSV